MKLLLDTHCWLWMQASPQRMNAQVRDLLMDGNNELALSAASSWEISIKYALGKLPLPSPPERYVPTRLREDGIMPLSITHAHVLRVAGLPAHHSDPFDRLIVAQSQHEGLTLLTADRRIGRYDVDVIWAD